MKYSTDEILAKEEAGDSLDDVIEGNGQMMPPRSGPKQRLPKSQRDREIIRISVDFTPDMLIALDSVVAKTGINRQASIKVAIQDYVSKSVNDMELIEKLVKKTGA